MGWRPFLNAQSRKIAGSLYGYSSLPGGGGAENRFSSGRPDGYAVISLRLTCEIDTETSCYPALHADVAAPAENWQRNLPGA